MALLLADLGLTKSHSRPHVSNDNPYSEAQFKTLKYRPAFLERFGGLEHASSFGNYILDKDYLDLSQSVEFLRKSRRMPRPLDFDVLFLYLSA